MGVPIRVILSGLLLLATAVSILDGKSPPNILLILADDLGYADVDWHDHRLHTPNLRNLAFSRHTSYLSNSYVNQLCTPTRSALMTGIYPFKTGTQDGVFLNAEPSGVPVHFTFFPQNLRQAGYRTYMIGKWHLGYCKRDYLPTLRGFDSFYGYYGPQKGYFNHSTNLFDPTSMSTLRGLDLFREVDGVSVPDFSQSGVYSTHLFTEETLRTLSAHARGIPNTPFFLYLAFQSVHSPLQAPDFYKNKCFSFSVDFRRQMYCAMLYAMDEAIGRVVDFLKESGLYRNTVIIFSSDNGGDPYFGASNAPLRGHKNTLWEGGTKTTTFVHSPQFIQRFTYRPELFHVVDWHPTILSIAGIGASPHYAGIGNGIDQWPMIIGNPQQSWRRSQLVYNIHTVSAIRQNSYKLINDLSLGRNYLFDLERDPFEQHDLSRQHPKLVRKLLDKIIGLKRAAYPPVRHLVDAQRGSPLRLGGAFLSYWC